MKAVLLALAVLSGCLASGQDSKDVSLGAPQFVAKGVKNVFWSVDGRSLAYTTETKDGLAVGVYDLDAEDGKTVYKLGKADQVYDVQWLRVGKKAVLIVLNKKDVTNLSVLVLDAHEKSAHQVWSRQFEKGTEASVDVDVSPSIAHALLTVQAGKTKETWVLVAGGSGMVFSRDIAAAEAQGQSFAGWSQAGTAVYGSIAGQAGEYALTGKSSNGQIAFAKVLGDTANAEQEVTAKLEFSKALELKLAPADVDGRVRMLGELPLLNFVFRMQPSLPVGASCLECVPSNGALRTVKFPGYYEEKPGPEEYPVAHSKLIRMVLGKSESPADSLWLVTDEPAEVVVAEGQPPKAAPEPKGGVLVSAQADSVWPSPYTRSIAFAWNGALFVRSVKYGK